MIEKKRMVIIGATSAIAVACARLWALEKPAEMILVGRDSEKLQRVSQDLQVRSPKTVFNVTTLDFLDEKAIQMLANELCIQQSVDLVLIAHGALPNQFDCQKNSTENRHTLEINAVSPALFAEAFASQMEKNNSGTIAVISSVAGDRGRKSNYVYGAAKGLLSRYVQGMQHRFSQTKLNIVLVKPGPTDTPMTAELKAAGKKMASADDVAECIVNGIRRKKSVIYAPKRWALIMLIVQHIPNFIFHKTNF